jgi:drug/metabolite transporter (DMT)-like permease
MIGEAFALFSATCYGLSGAAIAKGAPDARGDNGALLSIVLTALFSGALWLAIGTHDLWPLDDPDVAAALVFFVLAGVLSIVFGRLAMFRSVALVGAVRASLFRRTIPIFAALFAFLVLGEAVGAAELAGMVAILGSVALVMSEKAAVAVSAVRRADPADARRGQFFGLVSAGSYGASYVVRKLAMRHVPDPALGALVGAVTGIVWYLAAAPFSTRSRSALRGLVRTSGRWQVIAAVAMSLGQTSQFFALAHTDVATVAIIGSTEVFIAAYFAAFVLRTEQIPSPRVLFATVVATLGVVLVATG